MRKSKPVVHCALAAGALAAHIAAAAPLAADSVRERPAPGAQAQHARAAVPQTPSLHLPIAIHDARTLVIVSPQAIALADFAPWTHPADGDPFVGRITARAAALPAGGAARPERAGGSERTPAAPAGAPSRAAVPGTMPARALLMAAIGLGLLATVALGCGIVLREMRRRHHRRALG